MKYSKLSQVFVWISAEDVFHLNCHTSKNSGKLHWRSKWQRLTIWHHHFITPDNNRFVKPCAPNCLKIEWPSIQASIIVSKSLIQVVIFYSSDEVWFTYRIPFNNDPPAYSLLCVFSFFFFPSKINSFYCYFLSTVSKFPCAFFIFSSNSFVL